MKNQTHSHFNALAASKSASPPFCYTHLPPQHPEDSNYVVLPLYYPSRTKRYRVVCTLGFLLLAAVVYIFWPSDPTLKIVRLRLKHIKIRTVPRISMDISMFLTARVQNADVYSMYYQSVDVAVDYRGKRLGNMSSCHGNVRPRGSSYVDAELELYGIELLSDVVFFLEDLAKGTVPFDTVSLIKGHLGLLFFDFPLEAKLSCEILVNILHKTIVHQNCYHE
ncbi:Late embryogenesis abundant protein [Quillaja saponaria]|uniref:Late embryogenesis abundant protein n=1 Tax=Quillaja saponaria TaxID=32244 RepID=A0AAD7L5R8_QUISA|nr:Late embryogenesis abundant protein [Quillaja saponaria]